MHAKIIFTPCSAHAALFETGNVRDCNRMRDAFERNFAKKRRVDVFLDARERFGIGENLAALGLTAEAGGEIRHAADARVIPASFIADGAESGEALRETDA